MRRGIARGFGVAAIAALPWLAGCADMEGMGGRSGLATARALIAGEAEPLLWDDSPEARARAEAEGFTLHDLTRAGAFEEVALLVTSPGIPHLYPSPNKVIARAA